MTLAQLLRLYIDSNPSIRSIHTERLFRVVCGHWSRWLGREALAADFSEQSLVAYMRARRAVGRAEATVDNEATKLLVLWRFAARRGHCEEPLIVIHRRKPDAPRALLRHEIRALFRAASRSTSRIGGRKASEYYLALLGLIWNTSERINAIRELRRSDIDLRSGAVTIRERKGRGRTLVKPMSRSTRRAVSLWLQQTDSDQPFAVVGLTTVYYHLDRILADAKIEPERRNKFHALRRSHASYLKKAGGDATESLGHDREETTRVYYYDPRIVSSRSPATLLFDPMSLFGRILARFGL